MSNLKEYFLYGSPLALAFAIIYAGMSPYVQELTLGLKTNIYFVTLAAYFFVSISVIVLLLMNKTRK